MRMLKSDQEHQEFMPSKEVGRKLIHILSGIIIAYLILNLPYFILIFLTMLGLLSTLLISYLVKKGFRIPLIDQILNSYEREHAMANMPAKGVLMFILSLLILLILVRSPLIIASAVITLALGDGFATITGIRWGKHRLIGKKSLEGSAAFFLTSFTGLSFLLSPLYALIAAFTGTLIEMIPQEVIDDNITIPLGVSAVLIFLIKIWGGDTSI
ncbi:MAG: phosphatidate cytidylyltransferase [Candidatus Syntrophoarchaeum caldarius]|uniref:Phosphatidate cytidylyltransferase n=1 Tax=Candidatus Syntropharchaeum caldarium TaxID=1838285 RepID=A0A1F2PB48_9EURY|nr:MAG: phosphatidate cytidylyltransferase [Candidatus Syntrophoarchaeum caldarius]